MEVIKSLPNRKLAIALISNCHTFSSRETLIAELREALHEISAKSLTNDPSSLTDEYTVDVFGTCGDEGTLSGDEVDMAYLSRRYKFFLAFENSLCKDYVTEKMFAALQYPWIPVVYGRAVYEKVI